MKTSIVRATYFSSAHSYNPSPSVLSRPQQLGHNFRLESYFSGPIDPESGMIANLRDIDSWLQILVKELDHRHLEVDLDYFKTRVPSPENIAIYSFDRLSQILEKAKEASASLRSVSLDRVRVFEGDNLWFDFPSSK